MRDSEQESAEEQEEQRQQLISEHKMMMQSMTLTIERQGPEPEGTEQVTGTGPPIEGRDKSPCPLLLTPIISRCNTVNLTNLAHDHSPLPSLWPCLFSLPLPSFLWPCDPLLMEAPLFYCFNSRGSTLAAIVAEKDNDKKVVFDRHASCEHVVASERKRERER